MERDIAVVLSGGAVNGVLMELGFLKRLRESDLWPRVGWIYGTSSGALSGTMAALGRLDELEEFMLRLQPEETFRPHSLWRLPLLGSHDYRLPQTVAERIGDLASLARELREAPIDVTVFATAELREAEERGARGEPAHWPDMIVRLMRVAIQQNTVMEERVARDKDEALAALEQLRQDIHAIVEREGGRRGDRVARAVDERFANAKFPFLGARLIPRIAVQSTAGEMSLETGLRHPRPWTEEEKGALIARGYELLDDVLVERQV